MRGAWLVVVILVVQCFAQHHQVHSPEEFLEHVFTNVIENNHPHAQQPEINQDSSFVTVTTPLGTIQGVQENGYRVFRSVPYAQPPTGNNRWQPPIPVSAWNGVYDATQFLAACPQNKNNTGATTPFITVPEDEDCLTVSIWTPPVEKLNGTVPVMVWFHGGAFWAGWNGDGLFWGDFVVNSTYDTIVVTVNYRLGALGFLVTPELTGNYGFLDQQLALKWVQNNIGAFGGDPSKVTIYGQSAGGMSVTLHLLSPSSFGLYSHAIVESNPAGVNYRTPEQSYPYSEKLAGFLGCNYTDTQCLLSKSWQEVAGYESRCYMIYFPIETLEFMVFLPVIDGTIIPAQPMELFRSGQFNTQVNSVAFGTVRNETLAFFPDLYVNSIVYKAVVDAVFASNSSLVLEQYPSSLRSSNLNQFSILTTDWLFTCATRFAIRAFANQGIPVYSYLFLRAPSNDPINSFKPPCLNAACHSAELPFVRFSDEFVEPGSFDSAEIPLSWGMLTYWKNFAHGSVAANQYGPAWPQYSASSDTSLVFDAPISTVSGYHSDKCDFWDSLGYYN